VFMTFMGLDDPQVVHHFALEVQGIEEATFQEASGFENSSEVVEHRETDSRGRQSVNKQPGNVTWGDSTLKRGITGSMALWDWRQQVVNGDVRDARKGGSVVLYNSKDVAIARFDFVNGWPSKWSGPSVNTTDNSVAVEEITIVHEGLVRAH